MEEVGQRGQRTDYRTLIRRENHMSSGSRQAGGAANSSTRVSSGKKRGRVAWSGSAEESEDSDSAGSANQRSSSRPKKRFIWPEELHRDFIAAVFDMGLKKADPSQLKEIMPKKEKSVHPEALKSTLQKLRSFRYQMRSALGGDNLDTPEELAQKGIVSPGGGLALSLGNHANGSAPFTRLAADVETMEMSDLREAFEVPRELASAMERLESKQMRRSVELMGQCVQVQRSAHGVLMHAIEAQEALKGAIMDKVRAMGLPIPGESNNGTRSEEAQPSSHEHNGNSARHSEPSVPHASGSSSSSSCSSSNNKNNNWPTTHDNGWVRSPGGRPPSLTVRVQRKVGTWPSATSPDSSDSHASSASAFAVGGGQRTGASADEGTNTLGSGLLNVAGNSVVFPSVMGGMLAASSSAVGSAAGAATATATATGKNSQGAGRDYLGMAMPSGEDDGGIASFLCGGTTSDELLPSSSSLALRSASAGAFPNNLAAASSLDNNNNMDLLSGHKEEEDEVSMRMAMKTGMDMHRLMRSRQKNQLELHRPQQSHINKQQHQQQQQQHQRQLGKEGRHTGVIPVGSASLLPPLPPKRQSLSKASGRPVSSAALGPQSALAAAASAGMISTPSSITSALLNPGPPPPPPPSPIVLKSSVASGDAPAPLPPPFTTSMVPESGQSSVTDPSTTSSSVSNVGGEAATAATVAVAGVPGAATSANTTSGAAADMMDVPSTLAVDWNWDEDALDSHLFSFLLDSDEPT